MSAAISTSAGLLPHPLDADSKFLLDTLRPFRAPGKLGLFLLLSLVALALAAYIVQLVRGLAATALTDYVSWGLYIVNFVFWIGISMAGTLISAMLRLTGAHWRAPITRLAETITLIALLVAAPMVLVDMGRPDRFFNVLIHGRLSSPILWDVISLTTYLTGSLIYLYLPLIPDLAILRDHGGHYSRFRRKLYRVLALGWRNTPAQHARLERAITVMAIIIIPVAISIHTVTSWIFGMTLRPGWHSTIIAPDFVVAALYSGLAAVITAIAIFRRFLHLERFITADHFRRLGALLLVFCLADVYFVVNEYMGPGYTRVSADRRLLFSIFSGPYAWAFATVAVVGLIVPLILLILPWTRTVKGIFIASLLVNVGMWVKRYLIVLPTLNTTFLPPWQGQMAPYRPTWVEWSIVAGSFAAFCLLYTLFARWFPVVSVWEMREIQPQPAEAPRAT
jgi:molybdopterin-containing oxidoreductase family membrane subunit